MDVRIGRLMDRRMDMWMDGWMDGCERLGG